MNQGPYPSYALDEAAVRIASERFGPKIGDPGFTVTLLPDGRLSYALEGEALAKAATAQAMAIALSLPEISDVVDPNAGETEWTKPVDQCEAEARNRHDRRRCAMARRRGWI